VARRLGQTDSRKALARLSHNPHDHGAGGLCCLLAMFAPAGVAAFDEGIYTA